MLSPLGGWLDLRGAWDVTALSVEQWSHRATMGRDHFVCVVYRGFLYPFGHVVSLIKISERKFDKTTNSGYAAYLHQRMYMVINEKERTFTDFDELFSKAQDGDIKLARKFPFKSVKLLTEITPDLEIKSWPNATFPLFCANDKKGLLVAVEAKVKKNGVSSPKISVNCSLKHFDLILIAPKSFIELNFEKIDFTVNSAAKMDVDVLLSDIKFLGPFSFVETLRDLIPLNGFSDPPYLDITSKGIDAGFSISLPTICCGALNIANLSLAAGFTVPFIGEPLSVRFNFCFREHPFLLTVYGLGGGGFFGITIDPHGVQILEASLEFGAAVSIDFGFAKGGVHIMAGMYFRMENDEASPRFQEDT